MPEKTYTISSNTVIPFKNNADFCVGTGRMYLALFHEYFEQLKLVQEKIGFKYIRGHGLFTDDMAIYHEYEENGVKKAEYNFTYLDMVMDRYLELNLRPFLELGFMPEKMASGSQTVFYWKGNVTPPKDYAAWRDLVQNLLKHLISRYGADEVITWPIEVWNEPNLPGFWKGADMREYFRLFEESFNAVKSVDTRFRVGGPAICGVDDERWMKEFLQFCKEKKIAIDFITRHHYTSNPPETDGHYMYVKLVEPEGCMDSVNTTRRIVDSFPEFKDMEIHITEFNTSYVPKATIHDTIYNAAYTAYMLSTFGDSNESYSYWTFGDIFEEQGVPYTPFHGGFGLVANGLIPKPTFWTFQFFKNLKGECVHRTGDSVIVRDKNGKYTGIAWSLADEELTLNFALESAEGSGEAFCLITKTVDELNANPLKIWHDMGEPANLSKEQLQILRESSAPYIKSEQLSAQAGSVCFNLSLKPSAVVYFELEPVTMVSDRGFSYSRTISQR
ncbi:MAG: xylan 1,4-beta-xylosidase [Clostridiales bacterium]|jgi:xylan 1,4-beta-xylosidase|nr:xylan 1,4-beta-xylosidase [Clostridiales bacterium]